MVRSADDEVARRHLARRRDAAASFHPDPEVGDAGAELAGDLGRSFLEGAVSGEDPGELSEAAGDGELSGIELSESAELPAEELDEPRPTPRGWRRTRRGARG